MCWNIKAWEEFLRKIYHHNTSTLCILWPIQNVESVQRQRISKHGSLLHWTGWTNTKTANIVSKHGAASDEQLLRKINQGQRTKASKARCGHCGSSRSSSSNAGASSGTCFFGPAISLHDKPLLYMVLDNVAKWRKMIGCVSFLDSVTVSLFANIYFFTPDLTNRDTEPKNKSDYETNWLV